MVLSISPKKRFQEQGTKGEGAPCWERKRHLKYEVIGANWGEQGTVEAFTAPIGGALLATLSPIPGGPLS